MKKRLKFSVALWTFVSFLLVSCEGHMGGGSSHSSGRSQESSQPLNAAESKKYKKALIRCHKTGGSRIVKINGVLRCF